MNNFFTRPIQLEDNATLASIIRNGLKEFGADKPGTVYYDDSTDHLFELFQTSTAVYHVAILNEVVAGGAGIFPTNGLPSDTCELVKMYLAPWARGKGLARQLMHCCLESAKSNGFKKLYLETMPELAAAVKMYEQFGFEFLDYPMGNSGHCGCNKWMLKLL